MDKPMKQTLIKFQLILFIAAALLLLFNACNNNSKTGSFTVEPIDITIPVELEQKEEIKDFILEYQDFANEFNTLAVKLMKIAGIDTTKTNVRITEDDLSTKQMLKMARVALKQSKLSKKQETLMATMERQLPTLTEPEQEALQGVIALIDSQIGQFGGSNRSISDEKYSAEDKSEYDEETRRMLEEREMAIEQLKESGEWKEAEETDAKEPSQSVLKIIFYAIIGLFIFLVWKKRKKSNGFFQRLSHVSSELKSNYEKIPFDQLKNDPNISAEEKKRYQQGEAFIMDSIGTKTKEQATRETIEPEEAGSVVAHETLRQLYDTELKTSIAGIESKRKSIARIFPIIVALLIAAMLAYVLIGAQFYLNVIIGVVFIIAALVFFVKAILRYIKFRNEYKSSVVKKVVALINPKYQYDANKHISLNDFKMSKLCSNNVNKTMGDDYVCGKIDKTVFEFSEMVAQYEYETTNDEGKRVKETNTLFNGLFFLADFNKNIQGETFVMPDKAERLLGKFGQNFKKNSKGDLVKLENPEFEKYFAVFSNDQIEARYILTPAMMEGMVNIYKKLDAQCYFSFIGERVYCGIEFNKALFEASIFKPLKFADVEFMHSLFKLIETIIKEMNLNTRIWTKK